jgi:predicted transcriptional regulator
LSEKDCLRVFASGAYYNGAGGQVSDYMTRAVSTIEPDDELFQVADLFMTHSFRRLPVVEGGKLVGQVSRRDVLMASLKMCEESPIKPPFTDAKYLTDEMKAVLDRPTKAS